MKLLLLALLSGCALISPFVGGRFTGKPSDWRDSFSKETHEFIKRELPRAPKDSCLVDIHTHLAGLGKNESGIWVNPAMQSGFAFYKRLQFDVYLSASGIHDKENADHEYVQRLYQLGKNFPAKIKLFIYAFDYNHNQDGSKNLKRSTFYVPNDYVVKIAKNHPDLFIPVISIHPYREDAISLLNHYAKLGVKFVKWLPNAMAIDPTDTRSALFLKAMKTNDQTLITHTGEERAVDGEEFQKYGNPLLYRSSLNDGNKIIMAHVASLGECHDLENGNQKRSCFELFHRLFQDERYQKNLFADISAITIHTRIGPQTDVVLADHKNHERLINGSDYPLPAINSLYRTGELLKLGYITKEEAKALNEIYGINPLLFDLLLKRVLKNPKSGDRFDDSVFFMKNSLGVCS